MKPEPLGIDRMLTPAETAAYFGVDVRTLTRWAKAGRIEATRTLGGHRRYPESRVRALLARKADPPASKSPPID